jgi:hypothetical protein
LYRDEVELQDSLAVKAGLFVFILSVYCSCNVSIAWRKLLSVLMDNVPDDEYAARALNVGQSERCETVVWRRAPEMLAGVGHSGHRDRLVSMIHHEAGGDEDGPLFYRVKQDYPWYDSEMSNSQSSMAEHEYESDDTLPLDAAEGVRASEAEQGSGKRSSAEGVETSAESNPESGEYEMNVVGTDKEGNRVVLLRGWFDNLWSPYLPGSKRSAEAAGPQSNLPDIITDHVPQ